MAAGERRARSASVSAIGRLAAAASAIGFAISLVQLAVSQRSPTPSAAGGGSSIVFLVLPVVFGAAFAISIAFLKRRWWARTAMLLLVVSAFTAHLLWLVQGRRPAAEVPLDGPDSFQALLRAIRLVSTLYPIAACGLLAFVAARLMSPAVRREFEDSRTPRG